MIDPEIHSGIVSRMLPGPLWISSGISSEIASLISPETSLGLAFLLKILP